VDAFLRIYRDKLEDREDKRDLSLLRTAEQIAEARSATRYFPCWGGEVPEQFKGVQFDWEERLPS